jgi:uncharacterized membrane protein
MTAPPSGPTNGRSGRRPGWLGFVLVASLALNLFLGGIVVGGWVAGGGPLPARWEPGAGGLRAFPRLVQALPPEQRAEAAAVLAEHRGEIRRRFIALHRARRDVFEAMTRETVDRAALEQAFAGLRERMTAAQAAVQEALIEVSISLPPEQRRALAEAARGLPGMHRPRHGGPGRGPPAAEPPAETAP